MAAGNDVDRYAANLQAEREAVFLYGKLAESEPLDQLKAVYLKLAETEARHVAVWEAKLREAGIEPKPFRPGFRPRLLAFLSRKAGAGAVAPLIASIEKNAGNEYAGQTEAEAIGMDREEKSHARVFGYLARQSGGASGPDVARLEGRHRSGGNALRAGVLGANDGLISVFSLVMGIAGAGVGTQQILITGGAGLLAGALSMALGEWLSVQNARELYRHQLKIEAIELEDSPEEEREELSLIYQAKGFDPKQARVMADKLLEDKSQALDTLAREELAIDPSELGGSAWEAAITSFILFVIGAIFPVLPYFFFAGASGIIASGLASAFGLFSLGVLSSFMNGVHWAVSGIRQVLFGVAAGIVTFGIGHIIGISVG